MTDTDTETEPDPETETETEAYDEIRDGLHSEETETQIESLKSLFEDQPDDWAAYEPLVDDLIRLLEEDPFVREGAAIALGRIGTLDSDQRSRIEDLFDHEDETVGYRAVDVLYRVAQRSPEAVAPAAPSVVEFLAVRDGLDGETPEGWHESGEVVEHGSSKTQKAHTERRVRAVRLLGQIAQDDREALLPVVEDLVAIAGRPDRDRIRTDVLGILSAVAEDHPEAFEDAIDPVTAIVVEAEDADLRSNAAFLLAMIAEAHQTAVTDAVVDHREALFELLESDHEMAQNGAIGLLSYVGEERPDAVEPAKDAIVDLLEHDLESVRGNAIWTLSYVGGEDDDVRERLETLAEEDPNENIRQHAAETLAELTAESAAESVRD